MIERDSLYHIPYYKKSAFTGSFQGMHYRIAKINASETDTLQAAVWPGPYCCDATPDEKKEFESFEFSESGIAAACEWLNQKYEENKETYKSIHI